MPRAPQRVVEAPARHVLPRTRRLRQAQHPRLPDDHQATDGLPHDKEQPRQRRVPHAGRVRCARPASVHERDDVQPVAAAPRAYRGEHAGDAFRGAVPSDVGTDGLSVEGRNPRAVAVAPPPLDGRRVARGGGRRGVRRPGPEEPGRVAQRRQQAQGRRASAVAGAAGEWWRVPGARPAHARAPDPRVWPPARGGLVRPGGV